MSQSQKRKCSTGEKCHQVRDDTKRFRGDQATTAGAEECHSSPVLGGGLPSSPAPGPSQEPQGASAAHSPEAGISCPISDEGAQSQDEQSTGTSHGAPSTVHVCKDPLTRKAKMLVQFLLKKYKRNDNIRQVEMTRVVGSQYEEQFPEILRRASERMEVVYGLELKEIDPTSHVYALINMLNLPSEGILTGENSVPKTGLLMHILGVIFMKGNRATEDEIWEFLSGLGIFAGMRHAMFGDPNELITKDFTRLNYLEYRQMPNSDPPRYEFLWGPRAHAETTKMKVLQIMARLNDTIPTAYPNLYEEALRDEEARAAARAARIAQARVKDIFHGIFHKK